MDDAGFEEFCTNLLNLNPTVLCERGGRVVRRRILNAGRLQSGVAQRGGDIRAEVEGGEVWIFQCKNVAKFGPQQVDEAMKLAEAGWPRADQFVLLTSCSLSAEAQDLLQANPRWFHWNDARLTSEVQRLEPVESGIQLLHRHRFNPSWVKRLFVWGDTPLLSWQDLFSPELAPGRGAFHHRAPLVAGTDLLAALETFARRTGRGAMVLSAAGGQGKSRLLLELARRLEEASPKVDVKFLTLNRRGLSEEAADRIARGGNTLLVLDDGHRLDAVIEEVARATTREDARLLVATRPQAAEVIKSALYRGGFAEVEIESLRLPAWSQENLVRLAEETLEPKQRRHAPRLAALADRCPLLVVLGADLLNHGRLPETVTDETAFRERVFKGFRDEFLRSIPSDRKERVGRLIQFLSLVTPAPREDRLVDLAAGVLGCSALDIAEDIDALQAAGLVVENREGIRLYPDLFADAVLLDACLDFSGRPSRLHREIIARLPAREFPSLMRNLAQADWATRTRMRTRAPLFQPVWKSFLQRFRAATWEPKLRFPFGDAGNALGFLDGLDVQQQPVREQEDREALLGEWASVALFLPENTLELARLAMSMMADPDAGGTGQPAKAPDSSRAAVSRALPRLLGPLVVWHPDYAAAALEILWSLDSEELPENRPGDANGIGAIAAAATFEFDKPLSASQSVIDWLSVRLLEPGAIERLQREPWILSALLKPFFCREVERHWSAGRTVHFSSLPVALDRVRPLRQAALGLVERFFGAGQLALAHAVIPAVEEAIMPCCGRFGRKVTEQEQEAWRAERLAALRVIETAIELHKNSPSLLIRLRRRLWRCIEADPDPSLVAECRRTHARIPDDFGLRVARLLTSWPTDELDVRSGSDLNVGVTEAERQWEAFSDAVAREAVERYPDAGQFCRFLREQVAALTPAQATLLPASLLRSVAAISPRWCADLLDEMVETNESSLDHWLGPVLSQAANEAPRAYSNALDSLSRHGREGQVCSLILSLGVKCHRSGELSDPERRTLLRCADRAEEAIVCQLARTTGLHLVKGSTLALEVLSRLKPVGRASGQQILRALGWLVERHGTRLNAESVALCLENLGAYAIDRLVEMERHLPVLAATFPWLLYTHLRRLVDAGNGLGLGMLCADSPGGGLRLGPMGDEKSLADEIQTQWAKVVTDPGPSSPRLGLVRLLIFSADARTPDLLRDLIDGCVGGRDLLRAAEMGAAPGSKLVFDHPEIVRRFMVRGQEFGVVEQISRLLQNSACGGVRGFTNGEVDPEQRYILECARALANRYASDPTLRSFYEAIARSEIHEAEVSRQMLASMDEEG